MRLGRNFTNTLLYDLLTDEQKQLIASGKENLFSMNAWAIAAFKNQVEYQLERARGLGLDHLELDCDVPNPYADYDAKRCAEVRAAAEKAGITLSIHLSYSNSGGDVASLQELDRNGAVEIQKHYLKFGEMVGAKYAILHPGCAPFYYCSPLYLQQFHQQLLKTLRVLCPFASSRGMALHIENNVSFDNLFVEPEDCLAVINDIRKEGLELYFNLDIGHWFTRQAQKKPIPAQPEEVMSRIPLGMVKELHLNDFIIDGIVFHPPLHTQDGPLKKANLERYWQIVKTLQPEVIVLETAFKRLDQVLDREAILTEETKYIRGLFV